MEEKRYYRDFFLYVQNFIKLSKILDDLQINKSNYYQFVRHFDRKYDVFNLNTLEMIKQKIDDTIIELYSAL